MNNNEGTVIALVVVLGILLLVEHSTITPAEMADGEAGCARVSGTIVHKEIWKEGQIQTYVMYVVVSTDDVDTPYAVIVAKDTYYNPEYEVGFIYSNVICDSVVMAELLAFWNDVLRNPWITEWSPS